MRDKLTRGIIDFQFPTVIAPLVPTLDLINIDSSVRPANPKHGWLTTQIIAIMTFFSLSSVSLWQQTDSVDRASPFALKGASTAQGHARDQYVWPKEESADADERPC